MRIPEDLPVIDFDDITSRGYRSSADDGPNVPARSWREPRSRRSDRTSKEGLNTGKLSPPASSLLNGVVYIDHLVRVVACCGSKL